MSANNEEIVDINVDVTVDVGDGKRTFAQSFDVEINGSLAKIARNSSSVTDESSDAEDHEDSDDPPPTAVPPPIFYVGPGWSKEMTMTNNFTSVGALSCVEFTPSGGTTAVYLFWAVKQNSNLNECGYSSSADLNVSTWTAGVNILDSSSNKIRINSSAAVVFGGAMYLFYTTPATAGIFFVSTTDGVSWADPKQVRVDASNLATCVPSSPLSVVIRDPTTSPRLYVYYRKFTNSPTNTQSNIFYAHSNAPSTGWSAVDAAITLTPTPSNQTTGMFSANNFNDNVAFVYQQNITGYPLAFCHHDWSAGTVVVGSAIGDLNIGILSTARVPHTGPNDTLYYFNNTSGSSGLTSRFIRAPSATVVITPDPTVIPPATVGQDPTYVLPYDAYGTSGPNNKISSASLLMFDNTLVTFWIYNNSGFRIHYSVGFNAP